MNQGAEDPITKAGMSFLASEALKKVPLMSGKREIDPWDRLMNCVTVEDQEKARKHFSIKEAFSLCVQYLDWIQKRDQVLDKSDLDAVQAALVEATKFMEGVWKPEEVDPVWPGGTDLPVHPRVSLSLNFLMFGSRQGEGPDWDVIPINALGMLTEGAYKGTQRARRARPSRSTAGPKARLSW